GTYQDLTSLFLISTQSPSNPETWVLTRNVINSIDTANHLSDPPAVAIGKEKVHILYQAKRDDATGIQRMGLFYAHGRVTESAWSFQTAVGDEASKPSLVVKNIDGEDLLIAAWKEGSGLNAELAHIINDGSWSIEEPHRSPAVGLSNVVLIDVGEEVQVVHDMVDVYGDAISYGVFSDFSIGLPASLSSTLMDGSLVIGGPSHDGSQIVIVDRFGEFKIVVLADTDPLKDPVDEPSFWEKILAPLPGDEKMKKNIAAGIGASFLLIMLMVALMIRRARSRLVSLPISGESSSSSKEKELVEIVLTESDLEEDEELEITMEKEESPVSEEDSVSLQEDLEVAADDVDASERLKRRMQRVKEAEYAEKGLPLPPVLSGLPLPPPPENLGNEATTDIESALSAQALPQIDGLGSPPPPTAMDAPVVPRFGDLPPPPIPGAEGLPMLDREVRCEDCEVDFTVRDLTRKR
ncbi:MAG: hypothetical protein NZ770_03945, partial [Candidatus Poseidoniaceae archaeon]|nr:hypothetical protein [Candidatus Poseidoniaceae archaeon]